MRHCFVCDAYGAQKCHVKDKAELTNRNHDFHNIIFLCPLHHFQYFDKSRMAIVPGTSQLLLLHCVKYRRITVHESRFPIHVLPEYIEWKNERIHIFLKAELRQMQT